MDGPVDVGEVEETGRKNVATATPSDMDAVLKSREILSACVRKSIQDLKLQAESKGGFLSDDLRRKAWPVLLGFSLEDEAESTCMEWKELEPHKDEDQVQLDVNRAFVHYPNHKTETEEEQQKRDLSRLIVSVLRHHPFLCYFQGFHDICQVFLLVLCPRDQFPAVQRLSILRIRDFMLPTIAPAVAQLQLLPDILRAADPSLWQHLSLAREKPFFALSGTITMYAHDVQSLGEIARLFDVLLAREPVFSIYMFAAIMRSRREELFETPPDETDVLHAILSKLPENLDLDSLIQSAIRLEEHYPPESLRAWKWISSSSALKTARSTESCADQSITEGHDFFQRQVEELEKERERQKRLLWIRKQRDHLLLPFRKHRGPMRALGLAIFVGVVAVWLRRSPWPGWLMSCTGFLTR